MEPPYSNQDVFATPSPLSQPATLGLVVGSCGLALLLALAAAGWFVLRAVRRSRKVVDVEEKKKVLGPGSPPASRRPPQPGTPSTERAASGALSDATQVVSASR